MIKIDITDSGVQEALNRLAETGNDLRPVLEQIGEFLVGSTRQRFATSTAPDGTRWASNSQVTILNTSVSNLENSQRRLGRASATRPAISIRGRLIKTG